MASSAESPSKVGKPSPAPPARSGFNEDWLAVCIGLVMFVCSLALLFGTDLLGWAVSTSVWMTPGKALAPVSKAYATVPGLLSLGATYVFLLIVLLVGAKALHADLKRFAQGFTIIFFLSYFCWFLGSWAYIAATPDKRQAFKIGWSLNLTNESGFIIALLAGLVIGNFLPRVYSFLKEAIRPELYIKTAIVILGGFLGVTALDQRRLASAMLFQGLCAIVCAYLVFWPLVYFVARRYFGFSREWAAPLASGISICGVSAAIATGSAIRARAVVPVMVSSLVVVFSVVELLVLPFAAQHFLYHQPMVAGVWMGLAVKTDGAAVASGAIADALIRAKALSASGVNFQPGWILGVSTTVKVFIDIFIGVWAFLLAWIWSAKIERREGEPGQGRGNLAAFPQVYPRLRGHVLPRAGHRHCSSNPGVQGEGVHGTGECLPLDFLRHDLLLDWSCVKLPKTLAGRHREAHCRLCSVPVRIHHLGRTADLMVVFPRHAAADREGMRYD